MGREQTQKYGSQDKNGDISSTSTTPPTPDLPPPQSGNFFVKVGKGQNVFGIGGRNVDDPTTPEQERVYTINPYKNQAQLDFMKFTQQLTYDLFGGISPFSGKPLQVPPTASPTGGNGNGKTCTKCDSDKCQECDAWDIPCEAGHMFAGTCTPPEKPPKCDLGCLLTARGCDCGCKDVKPCTTCDSTVCKECNAWDLQCEDCKKKDGTCTPPVSPCGCLPYDFGCEIGCWWEKNKNYVYLIGGLIGLGVLLWLLRPLFGFAKSVTEVSKSAVTKVNGLK